MSRLLAMAILALALVLACAPALAQPEKERDPLDSYGLQSQGPSSPWRVASVRFQGFTAIKPGEAEEVIESKPPPGLALKMGEPYQRLTAERDIRRLQQLFKEQGYFSAEVTVKERRQESNKAVHLTFVARQGEPTLVEKTELVWEDDDTRRLWEEDVRELLRLQPGDRFVLDKYEETKRDIDRYFANQARPANQVLGQVRVYPEKQRAVILLKLTPGPRYLFGDSLVRGNKSIGRKFILEEATYTRGQPYSYKAMEETQRALLSTGFFSSATLRPLYSEAKGNMVPIVIDVRERDPHSIQLGVGWGTEDLLRVRIQQINRNILGWDETLSLEGKLSAIYTGLVGTLKKPYIFNRRSTLVMRGGIEQRDTEAFINNRLFINPALEYVINNDWSWFLGYNVEQDRMRELKTQVPDPSFENQTFFISSVPLGIIYDSRDSLLDATKGTYGRLEVETAMTLLGSDLGFIRAEADLRHVLPLPWERWYLAMRAAGGMAWALPGTETVPIIRRFFPGGSDSVRGYPYQRLGPLDSQGRPLGGESMALGSVEVRFPVYKELGGVVFMDVGNAWERVEDSFGSLRYTTGVGLRYNTPVGPLRVDIGYQLNPPANEPFDRYEAYLSVGQAF
ncbi:MAG: BamA/TamA family outer membrane protein [Desulfarculaceae bacterium]|nr:BamA/TamA family outer membrane protein [Desulfarculaceae bacterium]MCF8070948.1 BamA/TamA family outer membrane protein [Desulfarculaceae bacterium]MCF8100536.1 BamA/TamA family outer membrane protein [Desulfarculaceae bacterium]MCF8116562.1 BamA/TamA family outer membrane protein [Desulfarculaceae bacterium]